jgi:signal transduction histidine kinase
LTLSGLAVGLSAILAWQLRFGLAPLGRLRLALGEVRTGRAGHLPENFPEEVAGLVHELNGLIDHNAALIERARAQTGNLAHALKTPLAVLIGEARRLDGESGEVIRRRLAGMAEALERQLARARLAGAGRRMGARAAVMPVAENLFEAMARLHPRRRFVMDGLDDLAFQGEAQDMEEMLGNLLDNAGKWARRDVCLHGRRQDDRLLLTVEDDGPGIPPERRGEALGRGRRLDETQPGSGLGLAIIADLAELCGGRLTLKSAASGGLAAILDLPSAEG